MSGLYGPALPPGFVGPQSDEAEKDEEDGTTALGPQLPKRSRAETPTRNTSVYGPALPPALTTGVHDVCSTELDTTSNRAHVYGPKLAGDTEVQEHEAEAEASARVEEEDVIIGPLPVTQQAKEKMEKEQRRAGVDSRAKLMKDQLLGKDKQEAQGPKREEWMTELPPEVKAFGLGPRKFRTREVETGDRSVWTDTPADRLRKAQELAAGKVRPDRKEATANFTSARDEKLSTQVSDYNKECRSESLMELHRKRRAEEKDESKSLRRPFDREVDLKLPQNIITPAKRQALMKDSATSLEKKFSHGTQRFL